MTSDIKACVLRVGGTNCDMETNRALNEFDEVKSEVVRINKLGGDRRLEDFDCLVLPGGFSYGDHIRAGAVFANRIKSHLRKELKDFVETGGIVLGICNGFQILVETGLLPGFEGMSEYPTASLAINKSAKFECRWTHLKNENLNNCVFTGEIERGEELFIPVAHKEGRFMLRKEEEEELLERLYENDQVVLRYSDEDGNPAEGEYPKNQTVPTKTSPVYATLPAGFSD